MTASGLRDSRARRWCNLCTCNNVLGGGGEGHGAPRAFSSAQTTSPSVAPRAIAASTAATAASSFRERFP